MGREARINNKLTRKQTVFVRELATGKSGTQAAMAAYDVSNSKTASVIASQNLNKLSIREALDEALCLNGITPDLITSEIKALATKQVDKVSGDVKLKANIELLKLMGAYPGTKHANLNVNIKAGIKDLTMSQIKEELMVIDDELADVLGEATGIPTQINL